VKIENGRKRIIRSLHRSWNDWEVLIKDHHEGYITWAEFERNQCLISDNANRKSNMGRGSIRRGEALLAGLLRCARCGRKLTVSYSGKGGPTQRYVCRSASDQVGASSCISFGGTRDPMRLKQILLNLLSMAEIALANKTAATVEASETATATECRVVILDRREGGRASHRPHSIRITGGSMTDNPILCRAKG
jgi:Recombinase zinc beta ribbon domain